MKRLARARKKDVQKKIQHGARGQVASRLHVHSSSLPRFNKKKGKEEKKEKEKKREKEKNRHDIRNFVAKFGTSTTSKA